jgi:hypothetical protein
MEQTYNNNVVEFLKMKKCFTSILREIKIVRAQHARNLKLLVQNTQYQKKTNV